VKAAQGARPPSVLDLAVGIDVREAFAASGNHFGGLQLLTRKGTEGGTCEERIQRQEWMDSCSPDYTARIFHRRVLGECIGRKTDGKVLDGLIIGVDHQRPAARL
jgi:hypothetical protein